MQPQTMPPMSTATVTDDVALCWVYSRAMREGLVLYDLKPKEFWLAQVLVLDSYDRLGHDGTPAPLLQAPLRLTEWAVLGGFQDGGGVRCDKVEPVLQSLADLGIVAVNWVQGTFELRPAAESWSRLKGLRAKPRPVCEQKVLELSAERPLSESLSDLSREKALANAAVVKTHRGSLLKRLVEAVDDPRKMAALREDMVRLGWPDPAEKSAEKAGGKIRRVSAEKSAEPETADLQGFAAAADKSAESPKLAAAAVPVLKAAAASCASADKSAESSSTAAAAMAYLLELDNGHDTLQTRAEWAAAWTKIAVEHSEWVLQRLRNLLAKRRPDDPIAFASRIARDDGIWPGCRARPRIRSSEG